MTVFCCNRDCARFGANLAGREHFCASCGQPVAYRRSQPLRWQLSIALLVASLDDLVADPPHIKIRAKVCPLTEQRWNPKHGNERIVPLCAKALEIAQRAAAASPGPWLFFALYTQGKQKVPMADWPRLESAQGHDEDRRCPPRHHAHLPPCLL